MLHRTNPKPALARPSDALLPAALLFCALAGRESVSLELYYALLAARLLALASASGLRSAFALQPSMRYAQGSAVLALALQFAGSAIAALLSLSFRHHAAWPWFAGAALLLNIEHVFYEYLFAAGDGQSASLCRGLTALLTATGLLLCAPSGAAEPASPAWLPLTAGLGALIGLTLSLSLGGRLRPRFNAEILRASPLSALQAGLYPALALLLAALLGLGTAVAAPLFAGLILYEVCKAPFRRSPRESGPMLRALSAVCGVAAVLGLAARLLNAGDLQALPPACGALILAALCAAALFGSIAGREAEAQ